MILNNQNQKWEKHIVALCHVWNCSNLLRQDQNHRLVKPEWFGQEWAEGLDIVAICEHHTIGNNERFETFPNNPPDATVRPTPTGWDMSELQALANRLGDDGFIATGNPSDGTWQQVEPESVQHFDAEELKKLEPRVQDKEELKDFVFKHEVIDGNDFLYQEWLMDINEGGHKHIGGST